MCIRRYQLQISAKLILFVVVRSLLLLRISFAPACKRDDDRSKKWRSSNSFISTCIIIDVSTIDVVIFFTLNIFNEMHFNQAGFFFMLAFPTSGCCSRNIWNIRGSQKDNSTHSSRPKQFECMLHHMCAFSSHFSQISLKGGGKCRLPKDIISYFSLNYNIQSMPIIKHCY